MLKRLLLQELSQLAGHKVAEVSCSSRSTPLARGQRVLPLALRGGRDPDDRRRRRVGDGLDLPREGQRRRDPARAALPALGRAALLGVHLLPRLSRQLRRVQADGPGAVRRPGRGAHAPLRGGDPREDGRRRPRRLALLDQGYFDYATGLRMANEPAWERLFGFPRRAARARWLRSTAIWRSRIQRVTERVVLAMAAEAKKLTGSPNLCLAGGVALNCVATASCCAAGSPSGSGSSRGGRRRRALGAALCAHYISRGNPRLVPPGGGDRMRGSYLGPSRRRRRSAA